MESENKLHGQGSFHLDFEEEDHATLCISYSVDELNMCI